MRSFATATTLKGERFGLKQARARSEQLLDFISYLVEQQHTLCTHTHKFCIHLHRAAEPRARVVLGTLQIIDREKDFQRGFK